MEDKSEGERKSENDRLLEFINDEDTIDRLSTVIADTITPDKAKFYDRSVTGLKVERDMRYPINMFEESGKIPNLISFEFFHKNNPKIDPVKTVRRVGNSIKTFGSALSETINDAAGLLGNAGSAQDVSALTGNPDDDAGVANLFSYEGLKQFFETAGTTYDLVSRELIENQFMQGPLLNYPLLSVVKNGVARRQLDQVRDIRINRATERSQDRIFMYVPNTLSFSDSIDYEDGSQSALRTFMRLLLETQKLLKVL